MFKTKVRSTRHDNQFEIATWRKWKYIYSINESSHSRSMRRQTKTSNVRGRQMSVITCVKFGHEHIICIVYRQTDRLYGDCQEQDTANTSRCNMCRRLANDLTNCNSGDAISIPPTGQTGQREGEREMTNFKPKLLFAEEPGCRSPHRSANDRFSTWKNDRIIQSGHRCME